MKSLLPLCLFIFFASTGHTQLVPINKCVIEKGILKSVAADYDPTNDKSFITIGGVKTDFDKLYPATAKDYAINTSWYAIENSIMFNGIQYLKSGLPYYFGNTEVKKAGDYKGIGVYVETLIQDPSKILIPVKRGCEFQVYIKAVKSETKKIFYDENWRVTGSEYAAYYRIVTLDEAANPKGLVKDYYITGEKQWEGYIKYMDPEFNNRDVTYGLNTWYHKNGKKAAEVNLENGKENGVYRSWSKEGKLESETEYKDGLLHGYSKTWYPNGQLAKLENNSDGLMHGRQIYYLSNGKISFDEMFEAGNSVKPCYTALQEDNSKQKNCTEVFGREKTIFSWKYRGTPSSRFKTGKKEGLQIKTSTKSKGMCVFEFEKQPKDLLSIYTEFKVLEKVENHIEVSEYGLVWNYKDTGNFNYLLMTRGGWWSYGNYINGKRNELKYSFVEKNRPRGSYWNPAEGSIQSIQVAFYENNTQFSVNGKPFFETDKGIDFTNKGLGIISFGETKVAFTNFNVISLEE